MGMCVCDYSKSILAQGDAQRRLDEECNRYKKQIHWLTSILDAITSPLGVKRQDIVGKKCNNWGANICNIDDCGITCLRRGKDMGFVEVVQDVTKLNSYTNSLKKLMNDVHNSSDQVALGAKQISESSNTLAEGTVKQAGSIEELNSGIDLITTQTQTNATSAATASQLFDKSKENAIRGHQEMQVMLSSMNGIKEASNNISKIIKTIEDIAFQTNLLALNASVEAARAGEHGKGFAVVAEEVRTLAGRSQVAAKETDELIVESINRVGQGIHEIAQIVQTNSAMSQEVASASQELSNQAEILRSLVVDF